MARRRFEDEDDDRDPRSRRRDRGGSGWTLVLAVAGGLLVVGGLLCGGLMFLGYRQANRLQEEADAEMARADAEALAGQGRPAPGDAGRADIDGPVPAGVPPQPAAGRFGKPGEGGRWLILFRSADPGLWNTGPVVAGDDFALPLQYAPAETRYLRLRRMDTGEAVIVSMARGRLGKSDPEGPGVRWNGSNQNEHGGRHLGVATGPSAKFGEGMGLIGVLMDGWDATGGSGFGHAHHVENGGQRYAWMGKEIDRTAFELAVTTGELTAEEKGLETR